MSYRLIESPAISSTFVDSVKAHARIGHDDEDAFLQTLIEQAVAYIEQSTKRSLFIQKWTLACDIPGAKSGHDIYGLSEQASGNDYGLGRAWGALGGSYGVIGGTSGIISEESSVTILRCPVVSIEEIRYYNMNDEATIIDSEHYRLDRGADDPRCIFTGGLNFISNARIHSTLEIDFIAGYSSDGHIPTGLRSVIIQLATYWYEHRGDDGSSANIPIHVRNQCLSYQIKRSVNQQERRMF